MSPSRTLCIGMDVHTDALAVASVAPEHGADVPSLGAIGTRQGDLAHLLRQMPSQATPLGFIEAAGPCGYWLSRYLTPTGQVCWVVAPAVIPKKSGERVTTNRRAAIKLARLMRSGDLPPVSVPQGADEAMRDRGRAREEARRALKTAKFRLNAFLLRHDIRYTGRATWGPAHRRGLSEVVCPTPAPPLVFPAYVRAVTEPTERLARLEHALTDPGQTWRLAPVVDALPALRGGPCTGAVTAVAALGDLTRFDTPRPRMR